jgi:hypothetical protein
MPSSGRRASIVRGRSDVVSASACDLRVRDAVSVGLTLLEREEPLEIPSEINTANSNRKPIPTEIRSMSIPSEIGATDDGCVAYLTSKGSSRGVYSPNLKKV